MKFVVNRVHHLSSHNEADLQNLSIKMNSVFESKFVKGYCEGLVFSNALTLDYLSCLGFTIAEIDDEGYLM